GLKVGWASPLGADTMARYRPTERKRKGIEGSHAGSERGERTARPFKGRADEGRDPPVGYRRKGSAGSQRQPADTAEKWTRSARHLHSTGVFAAISDNCYQVTAHTMDLMRAAGKTVSFDPNLRPTLWATTEKMRAGINELASKADWVFPGLDEGRLLTGQR